jgi:hypothetical protein
MLRSLGAVFAGIVVNVVLSTATDAVMHASGVFPPVGQAMSDGLFALALAYRLVYTVLGGYVTAWVARHDPMKHVIILGVAGIVLGTMGVVATWNKGPEFGPKWYPIALVITALPVTWLGGKLRASASEEGRTATV